MPVTVVTSKVIDNSDPSAGVIGSQQAPIEASAHAVNSFCLKIPARDTTPLSQQESLRLEKREQLIRPDDSFSKERFAQDKNWFQRKAFWTQNPNLIDITAVRGCLSDGEEAQRRLAQGQGVLIGNFDVRMNLGTGTLQFQSISNFKSWISEPYASARVVIGILAHQEPEKICRLIECIKSQTHRNIQLVILEQSGTSHAFEKICKAVGESGLPSRILKLPKNHGATVGRNIIIDEALERLLCDFVCFLDDDTTINKEFVAALVSECMSGDNEVGAAGPLVRWSSTSHHHAGKVQTFGGWFPPPVVRLKSKNKLPAEIELTTSRAVDYIVGPAVFYSASALRSVGPYDGRLFVYGEELDMGAKLAGAGFHARVTAKAVMDHDGRGADDGGEGSPHSYYLRVRNALFNFQSHSRLQTLGHALRISQFALKSFLWPKGEPRAEVRTAILNGLRDGIFSKGEPVVPKPSESADCNM